MKPNWHALMPLVAVVLIFTGDADAKSIFVDNGSTATYEDGSRKAPFLTITRGLDEARKFRFGPRGKNAAVEAINIFVAPSQTPYLGSFAKPGTAGFDPTQESFPLLLNIPNLRLRGGTRLTADENGLPAGVVPGTETVVEAIAPQGQKQHILLVTRTIAESASGFPVNLDMAGNNVTVSGFWFQADAGRVLPSAVVGIDSVGDFHVRGNVFVDGGNGVWARLSSGIIEKNLAINNAVGFYLTGGSQLFPAHIQVLGNRTIGESAASVAGLGLIGSGDTSNRRVGLDFGAYEQVFVHDAPPAIFSRSLDPESVPDLLTAEITRNEFSGHSFGIRIAGYLQDPYSLEPGEVESANVVAEFHDNLSNSNQLYGLVVDAGQIALDDRRTMHMALSFGGVLEQNALAPAIFSHWRLAGSIAPLSPSPFSQPNPTFAHDSSIRVCGNVTRFHFDNRQDPHPPTNPVPTNNELVVNDVALIGHCVGACVVELPAMPLPCTP